MSQLRGSSRVSAPLPFKKQPPKNTAPAVDPCKPVAGIPTPGSELTNRPSALTVIGPTISNRPVSWLKLQSAVFDPAGRGLPVAGLGRLGKQTGAGLSK